MSFSQCQCPFFHYATCLSGRGFLKGVSKEDWGNACGIGKVRDLRCKPCSGGQLCSGYSMRVNDDMSLIYPDDAFTPKVKDTELLQARAAEKRGFSRRLHAYSSRRTLQNSRQNTTNSANKTTTEDINSNSSAATSSTSSPDTHTEHFDSTDDSIIHEAAELLSGSENFRHDSDMSEEEKEILSAFGEEEDSECMVPNPNVTCIHAPPLPKPGYWTSLESTYNFNIG